MTYITILWSFLSTKLGRYALLAAIAASIVFGAYIKGRSDYKEVCEARAAAELLRQADISARAIAIANSRIAALEAESDALEKKLQEVQDEADKDPAAVINGIGPDSVRRIDQIR